MKSIQKGFNLFMHKSSRSYTSTSRSVVIVAGKRTPIGSLMGSLSSVKAPSLSAITIRSALKQSRLNPEEIDEVILGNVLSAGIGQAPARQAAIKAGLPVSTVCTTINKVCASGMKSMTLGAQSILLGNSNAVLTGGFESMSLVPHLSYNRKGMLYGNGLLLDSIFHDGLLDPYDNIPMGSCSEKTVRDYSISRQAQDDYTELTYKRASEADFSTEITSVDLEEKGKVLSVTEDEEIKRFRPEKFRSLKPVFDKDGTITAANASKINDGACSLILMDEELAKSRGIKALARVKGFADSEVSPIDFSISPSSSIQRLLKEQSLTVGDISAWEINEAFACVALANMKILGLKEDKVNLHGGAVALGHPIGMSGARIVLSLMNVLRRTRGGLGIAAICNGGGGSTAVLIENLV